MMLSNRAVITAQAPGQHLVSIAQHHQSSAHDGQAKKCRQHSRVQLIGNAAMVPRGPHLYSTFGLSLDVLDLVPALAHHVFDLVCWQLQLQVRLFFAVTVRRQQLVQLGHSRLLAVLQCKSKAASVSNKSAGLLCFS